MPEDVIESMGFPRAHVGDDVEILLGVVNRMRSVTAYATPSPKSPFGKTTIERRDVGAPDVLIKIAYTGICHSDIHTGRGEWGGTHFPLVPDHEIASIVEKGSVPRSQSMHLAVGWASVTWWTRVASAETAWPARSGIAS